MSKGTHFIISASLGAGIHPTAIAVHEQEIGSSGKWRSETKRLSLRHLERMPAGASYPDIAKRISTTVNASEIKDEERCGGARVVVDVTGSGRAPLELIELIRPEVVTITGTTIEEIGQRDWQVPKLELVGALRVAYEADRLKMAEGLDLVSELLGELRAFKMRPPRIDPSDPESWRETEFDDLVIAVALGVWQANRHVPKPRFIRDAQSARMEEHRRQQNRQYRQGGLGRRYV